jgi:elongator complex protein 1
MKLTPIRVANVPPPMALHEITLEVEAIDVAVNLSNTKIAVLHRTSFTILSYDPRISLGPVIERIEDLPISDFVVARQICYKGDDEVLVLMNNLLTNESLVYDCLNQQESQIPNSTNVLRLFPSADYSALFLATEDMVKQVDTLENTTGLLEATTVATIPAPAPWVEVVQCGEEVCNNIFGQATTLLKDFKTIVVTLTASGTLSANERQLIRNCTSFVLAQSHLILTTSNHFLKFIHLCSDVSGMATSTFPLPQTNMQQTCKYRQIHQKMMSDAEISKEGQN